MKKRAAGSGKKKMPVRRRIVLILLLILLALAVFFTVFHTKTVLVSGNTRYSDEDIKSICLDGAFSNNTVLFTLFNRSIELGDMPYLDHVDSEMIDRETIHLSVTERIACGRTAYGGKILYFDRNGIVLEIKEKSDEQDTTAVLVEGPRPDVEQISEGDVIFADDEALLSEIYVLSLLLLQYELVPDKVVINSEHQMILSFGDVRVNLGGDTYLEEKVARADAILPDIQGTAGILHLEDYSEDSKDIIYEAV